MTCDVIQFLCRSLFIAPFATRVRIMLLIVLHARQNLVKGFPCRVDVATVHYARKHLILSIESMSVHSSIRFWLDHLRTATNAFLVSLEILLITTDQGLIDYRL